MPAPRGAAAIAAATALNLPFGTLYAFSVFLEPMERLLGVGRAEMSIVFALATITLTVGPGGRSFSGSRRCSSSPRRRGSW